MPPRRAAYVNRRFSYVNSEHGPLVSIVHDCRAVAFFGEVEVEVESDASQSDTFVAIEMRDNGRVTEWETSRPSPIINGETKTAFVAKSHRS